MKATNFFVMALTAMLTMGLCSCEKQDNNENNSGNEQPNPNPEPQPGDEDGWVNLGLPSGLLWATQNIGAHAPEDYGNYYAWAETTTKASYNWETYVYNNGDIWDKLTKYCNNPEYGYNGFTDNLTRLQPMDDAATAFDTNMRTPTAAEWQELINNTTYQWVTINGVAGVKLTAANGKSIFLPAAGKKWLYDFNDRDEIGYYWSSTLDDGDCTQAKHFEVSVNEPIQSHYERANGMPVRPVRIVRN